jgi:hypothetical protein
MTSAPLALTLLLLAPQAPPDLASLFKAFRNASDASAPLRTPKDVIRLYATDDLHTKLCYISGDVLYLYADGRVTRPLYAKMFNVKAVNRITYVRTASGGGAFQIWTDDDLTLSLGI